MSAARTAPRQRPSRRTQPTTVGWLAIIMFGFLAGVGAIAAITVVGLYTSLTEGLDDPDDADELRLPRGDDRLRPDRHDRIGAVR